MKEIKVFEYHLKNDMGDEIIVKNPFNMIRHGKLQYKGVTYVVINCDDDLINCREIPENLFGNSYSRKSDVDLLNYEEKLISFFKKREENILPNTLNESYFKKLILNELKEHFEIEEEVWGKHFSGRKMKIDVILKPKDNSEWRNKDLVIGLEIKNPLTTEMNNRRDVDLLSQCLDYSFSEFKKYKNMIVIICPLIPKLQEKNKLFSFVSRYNVGYLDFIDDEIIIGLGKQIIWRQKGGITPLLKNSMLNKKYGNRSAKK